MKPPRKKVDRDGREYVIVDGRWTKDAPTREFEFAGQIYSIDGSALPELGETDIRRTRLIKPSDTVLKVVPPVSTWFIGVCFAVVGVAMPVGWIVYLFQHRWTHEIGHEVL